VFAAERREERRGEWKEKRKGKGKENAPVKLTKFQMRLLHAICTV